MRDLYDVFQKYFFHGIFAYALFGLYSLTICPYITQFIDYNEKSIFIAVLGFFIYVTEFFAITFKLKMIRIRSEMKRKNYKDATGQDIIPTPSKLLFFGLMFRIVLRSVIIMVAMTSLGFPCTEKEMSTPGLLVLLSGIFLEIMGFGYIYQTSGLYSDFATNEETWLIQEKEREDWNTKHFPLSLTTSYIKKELLSDVILHIYALILFTSIWYFVNEKSIGLIQDAILQGMTINSALLGLLPMLISMSIIWQMPLRVAYWIEDSMMAFRKQEVAALWIFFVLVSICNFVPTIVEINKLFFPDSKTTWKIFRAENINLTFSIFLFSLLAFFHSLLNKVRQDSDFTGNHSEKRCLSDTSSENTDK